MRDPREKERDSRDVALINARIRAPMVQVITHEGENIGVVSRVEALRMAEAANLDLVMLSETGGEGVPVVRVMDFGKVLYEKKKKQGKAKKHQKVIQVKEIKLRPKIGDHDLLIKIKQASDFLREGKRVKFTLSFKGRENILKEQHGLEIFARIDQVFAGGSFETPVTHEPDSRMGQMWSRVYYLK